MKNLERSTGKNGSRETTLREREITKKIACSTTGALALVTDSEKKVLRPPEKY